jgi:hypothetical protein
VKSLCSRLSSLTRTAKVAAVNCGERFMRYGFSHCLGLPMAIGIEGYVDLPLHASFGIPGSLTMANNAKAGGGQFKRLW